MKLSDYNEAVKALGILWYPSRDEYGFKLWFQGAPWLKEDESGWKRSPAPQVVDEDSLEVKPIKSLCTLTTKIINYEVEKQLIVNCSSFSLLVRSLACVYRVIYNFKSVVLKQGTSERHIGELTLDELYQAKIHLLQAVQHEVYGQELDLLRKEGTLRVGGRLHNSAQPYEVKHPIILPQNHRVTELLVHDLHLRNLHAGSSLLTAIARQQYWIVGCQTVVRKVVQGCMRCVRLKGKTAGQLMGTLPPARVLATRAFSHVGIDYAGPLKLKATCIRGINITKGYIVVFVCLSTRAVHLEVANDLSSNTFLGSLKRFISRRGCPIEIRSDNGTNFIGADRILQQFIEQIMSNSKDASRYLSNLGIKWVFNPPSAPHMGGIWEAAVRSVKKHLVAELGEGAITFEDVSTVLCQIESCLNSRPLCPLPSDPDCAEALTPRHFLIGQPMNLVPEPNMKHPSNRLDRWQEMQRHTVNIWNRWKDEYLASLQLRTPSDFAKMSATIISDGQYLNSIVPDDKSSRV
ncbi:uncharacterized protein LOC135701393 [Ochlerotatus camptorhynchus]|uniref:uncharacterized protein LOC135701393 n=1 Tax=Ochlerotatus camptorhynchus TaxID=644619 RepID=UPI0031D6B64E